MATTQGKCSWCRVLFCWKGKPLLREALCPGCKRPLERTSRASKLPRSLNEHPLMAVR